MAHKVHMGYMGNLVLGYRGNTTPLLCSDMDEAVDSSPKFYDHIQGLRDKDVTKMTKGPAPAGSTAVGGTKLIQKKFYRYSPRRYTVRANGPVPEQDVDALLQWAISGDVAPVDCIFWKSGKGRRLKDAVVSSLALAVKAGEVATYTVEVVGLGFNDTALSVQPVDCKKLVTWDACHIVIGGNDSGLQDFSITISNPIVPIYVANSLDPKTLRIAVQEVTGSFSAYGWDEPTGDTLQFTFGGNKRYELHIVYGGRSEKGNAGPIINTTPFFGTKDTPLWTIT